MNDSTNYWPMPAAFTTAPMRWVLTGDGHNCSGIPCPRDTFCMRPEPFAWPNYCVHKQAMHDVPELLAKGPAMIYCEDIGQAVLAAILAMILLVQVRKNNKNIFLIFKTILNVNLFHFILHNRHFRKYINYLKLPNFPIKLA